MKQLDFTGEDAIIVGDSFGPSPVELSRTGFNFTGSVIDHIVYKEDIAAPIFTYQPTLDVSTLGKLSFSLYRTPTQTAAIKAGNYKQVVRITWPNTVDKNSMFGGEIEFKDIL